MADHEGHSGTARPEGQGNRANRPTPRWRADPYVRSPRFWIQLGFLLASALTGLHFHRFALSLADPALPQVTRPAEVDAWLPISSFTSLVYLLKSGVANTVHPAGLVLFTLILVMAFAARRGFCSWVCPVGTLSEWAHRLGESLFGRAYALPRLPDALLRAVKYLLLGFFAVMITGMSAEGLHAFIHGAYNRVCDLKMYALFARPSVTTLTVVAVLVALSLAVKNFWCRYLCPYGALLGLVSMASPLAVRRDSRACTGCGRCSRACQNRIDVARVRAVRSPECTACYACVGACPEPDALRLGPAGGRGRLTPFAYAVLTLAALVLLPQAFRALGYWDTDTPVADYRRFFAALSEVGHP